MRIEGLEGVAYFVKPLSFMSTKRIDIEAEASLSPAGLLPYTQILFLLFDSVARGQWEEAVPCFPEGLPWSEESWYS